MRFAVDVDSKKRDALNRSYEFFRGDRDAELVEHSQQETELQVRHVFACCDEEEVVNIVYQLLDQRATVFFDDPFCSRAEPFEYGARAAHPEGETSIEIISLAFLTTKS